MPKCGSNKFFVDFHSCHILATPVFTFASKKNTTVMEKMLHIVPKRPVWESLVYHWVKKQPDNENHKILSYPIPADQHYVPESFDSSELMRTALSWEKTPGSNVSNIYKLLQVFADILLDGAGFDKIIVWHAEDVGSRMLFCMIMNSIEHNLFEIDITPADKKHVWEPETDNYEKDIEVPVFTVDHLCWNDESISSYTPKRVTQEIRNAHKTIWMNWAGEDVQDCPIIINQFGRFVHVYRTYLYSDILSAVSKTEPRTAAVICGRMLSNHPQLGFSFIYDSIVKMADEGFIKYATKDKSDPLHSEFLQYKYDVEGDWNRWPRDFVYQFISYCGKKIKMSEDDMKAEFIRAHRDCDDMWGKGHLTRKDRKKRRHDWEERMVVKWAAAFNENWGWYHLMSVMKVKLEMMVEYMRHWTPIANGPVYADQMERAISLMEIIIDWGGESKYAHTEGEEHYFDAKHFSPHVNMRNRKRFPSPDYDGHTFWCKAQRVRFDKAWNILWEMLRTKMLTWED